MDLVVFELRQSSFWFSSEACSCELYKYNPGSRIKPRWSRRFLWFELSNQTSILLASTVWDDKLKVLALLAKNSIFSLPNKSLTATAKRHTAGYKLLPAPQGQIIITFRLNVNLINKQPLENVFSLHMLRVKTKKSTKKGEKLKKDFPRIKRVFFAITDKPCHIHIFAKYKEGENFQLRNHITFFFSRKTCHNFYLICSRVRTTYRIYKWQNHNFSNIKIIWRGKKFHLFK